MADSKNLIRGVRTRSDGFRNEVAAHVKDQARILSKSPVPGLRWRSGVTSAP
jgi:hypothetical protein